MLGHGLAGQLHDARVDALVDVIAASLRRGVRVEEGAVEIDVVRAVGVLVDDLAREPLWTSKVPLAVLA